MPGSIGGQAADVVAIEGLNDALRMLRRLPREAQTEIRARSTDIARRQGAVIAAYGRGASPQAAHVTTSIRVKSDRVPSIRVGGRQRLSPRRHSGRAVPTAGQLMFGSEFGKDDWRFPPVTDSYWLIRGLRAVHPQAVREWAQMLDYVARQWSR